MQEYPMVRSPKPFHRLTAAITSWFRLPDQGMRHYEMLCRGTAFCVKQPDDPKLYFFTCSHVAAPWKWPKLYPLPWLQHVNEEQAGCVLQVTEPATGRVLGRVEMDEDVTHHFDLDACVLTLRDQDKAVELFERHGMPLTPLTISKAKLKQGQMLVCPGYGVSKAGTPSEPPGTPEGLSDDEARRQGFISPLCPGVDLDLRTDAEVRRLSVTPGAATSFHDGGSRGFVHTDAPLADGVCGAPMVDLASGECVGLMEGVVPDRVPGMDPESEVHKIIAGSAAVVYGPELADLLDEARGKAAF